MEVRQFSMREALEFLGLKPPGIQKGMSQNDIDAMVKEWKETELLEHYKEVRKAAHPDRNGSTVEAKEHFQSLTTAYEEVKANLKLRKPRVPPERVTECRVCDAPRVPSDAVHCHDCGLRYETREPAKYCAACDAERNPTLAKFCHACGYDYQVPDQFLERLRSTGFTEDDIVALKTNGTIDRWRRRPALDPELASDIKFELAKRKMVRGQKGDFTDIFRDASWRK